MQCVQIAGGKGGRGRGKLSERAGGWSIVGGWGCRRWYAGVSWVSLAGIGRGVGVWMNGGVSAMECERGGRWR